VTQMNLLTLHNGKRDPSALSKKKNRRGPRANGHGHLSEKKGLFLYPARNRIPKHPWQKNLLRGCYGFEVNEKEG